MRNFAIVGTDASVGKSYIAKLIVNDLKSRGLSVAYFKPIACGTRQEVRELREVCGIDESLELLNPYYYRSSVSTAAAAEVEGKAVNVDEIKAAYAQLSAKYDCVVVEGGEGVNEPLNANGLTAGALMQELGVPSVLIIGNKRGAVNHALMSTKTIENLGGKLLGVIFNTRQDEWDLACVTNRSVFEKCSPGIPVIDELIHGQDTIDIEILLEHIMEDKDFSSVETVLHTPLAGRPLSEVCNEQAHISFEDDDAPAH